MKLRLVLTILSLLLLTACLSDDSQTHRPPERITSTISGIVFDAAVSNSVVRVFEFNEGKIGKQLGSTVTNPSGEYRIEVMTGSMPVYIEARGGLYIDPYTNNQISENNRGPIKLAAYLNLVEGSEHTVMITPLSNAAAGHIEYDLNQWGTDNVAGTINTSHSMFNQSYGLDIIKTRPLDLKSEGVSAVTTVEHLYGALLMAYSSYSFEHIETDNLRRDTSGYTSGQTVYTSYNLADIQYRDLASTGVMDGWERVGDSQVTQPLTFGLQIVDGELYSYELARHILRVVNDPNINRTGTNPKDYLDLAQHLSESTEGLFPSRTPVPLNTQPPQAKRVGDNILVDLDQLTVNVSDFYGIAEISAEIWTLGEDAAEWQYLWTCSGLNTYLDKGLASEYDSEVCHQTNTELRRGTRDIDLVFDIDTLALESEGEVSRVRLVLDATDLLGLSTAETSSHNIEFLWDNDAIIVEVDKELSPHRYNPNDGDYRLRGTITRGLSDLDFTGFQVGLDPNAHVTSFYCIFPDEDARVCDFDETVDSGAFVSDFSPILIHVLSRDDEIRHIHDIYKDTLDPEVNAYFPASDMKFIKHDAPREHLERYTVDKFNDINSELYLKVDRVLSTAGVRGYLPNFDFKDANQTSLNQHHIPSIRFQIGDFGEHPTSAENLKFDVHWEAVSQTTGTTYETTVTSVAADYEDNEEQPVIPFESYRKVGEFLAQMTYVVPFSTDIFGHDLIHVDKDFIQTLTVTVTDEAGNSEHFETRFRSTMNDPHLNVFTPFEDALVTLYSFTEHGNHYPIGTCVTEQMRDPVIETETQQDLAGCTVQSVVQGQPVRVVVDDAAERSTYQWREDQPMETLLETTMAFSDIFYLPHDVREKDIYITEVAVYKSGFFDFLWENDADRTQSSIVQHITEVDKLFDEPDGFFHFIPPQIRYATNIDLDDIVTPEFHYQHRFLAESMLVMARDEFRGEVNSVELAKAFYEDFKTGTLNGKDSNGNQITVGSKDLKQYHYRYSLAEAYLEVVRHFASHDDDSDFTWTDAMKFANDHIAFMEPTLSGNRLFDEGTAASPDKFPPEIEITLSALDGQSQVISVNESEYVKGSISVLTHVYDPSGIEGHPTFERCIKPTWTLLSLFFDCENYKPDGHDIHELEGNQSHRKFYNFELDSANLNESDTVYQEFHMDIFVSDMVGNDWYPEGNQSGFYIDNDAPVYNYRPPFVEGDVDLAATYFNLNEELLFEFDVTELVGEDTLSRIVSLFDKEGMLVEQYDHENLINGHLKLCAQANESCRNDDTSHGVQDGKWSLKIDGADLLGNDTVESQENYIFPLMIDSSAPVITDDEIGKGIVGGDYRWDAGGSIDYGSEYYSDPGDVNISIIHPGENDPIALQHCDDENPGNNCRDNYAYLVGERHETSVVIVSDLLENEGEYTFIVNAFDSAVPLPNEGTKSLSVEIDNQGPIINLAEQPIDNNPHTNLAEHAGSMVVPDEVTVGTRFSILIDNIEDRSDLQSLQVIQLGHEREFLLKEKQPETAGQQSIRLLKEHTDNIDGADVPGASDISLIVRGFDEWGNIEDSSAISVRFVNSEPSATISEYDVQNPGYYTSNYRFDVEASNDREQIPFEKIRFQRADADEGDWLPLEDEQISVSEANNFVLSVIAEDSVGNFGISKFNIKVDNQKPNVSTLDINDKHVSDGDNIIDWDLIGGRDNDGVPVVLRYEVAQEDIGRIESVTGTIDDEALSFVKVEGDAGRESWVSDITSLTSGPDDAYGSYEFFLESIKDTLTDGVEDTHISSRNFDVIVDLDRSAPIVTFADPTFENLPEFEVGTLSLLDRDLVSVGPIFNILIDDIEDNSKVTAIHVKQSVNGQAGPTLKVIANEEGIVDLSSIQLTKAHTSDIVTDFGDNIELYLYLEDEHGNGGDSEMQSVEFVWQTPHIRFDTNLEHYYSSNYEFEVFATNGEEDVQAIEVNVAEGGWVLVNDNRFSAGSEIHEDFALAIRATNRVGQRTESDPVQIKIDNQPPQFDLAVNGHEASNEFTIDWNIFDDYDDTQSELKITIAEQDRTRIHAISATCEGERCPDNMEFVPGGGNNQEFYTLDITSITQGDLESEDGRGEFIFDITIEKDTQVANGEEIHIASQSLAINVNLDRTAPQIDFDDPVVINRTGGEARPLTSSSTDAGSGITVGEAFDIMIREIHDESRVVKLEVYEVTNGIRESIKVVEASGPQHDLSDTSSIVLLKEDTDRLSSSGELTLLVSSMDEHTNEADSESFIIDFDNSEPSVILKDFKPDEFYSPAYEFEIEASSGSQQGQVDLFFKRSAEAEWTAINGQPTIDVESEVSYTLWLKAVNKADKAVINTFDILVDNSDPEADLHINGERVIVDGEFNINWSNHDDDEPTILTVTVTSEDDEDRVDHVSYCLSGDCEERIDFEQSSDPSVWSVDISEITLGDEHSPDGQGEYLFDVRIRKHINSHPNEGALGTTTQAFKVTVDLDRTEPEIVLAEPPVSNIAVGTPEPYFSDNTVGRVFDINFETLEDEKSDIIQLIVFQRETGSIIKHIDGITEDGTTSIRLSESDTANLEVAADNRASLYIVAEDTYGNRAESDDVSIVYIADQPTITLVDFDPDNHYVSDYEFTVEASNGSDGAIIDDLDIRIGDGANNEFAPLEGNSFQVDRETGTHDVYIRATNEVGASTISQFTIKIDNEMPSFTVLMNEDSPIQSGDNYMFSIDKSNMGDYRLNIRISEPDYGRIDAVVGNFEDSDLTFTQSIEGTEIWHADLPSFVEESQNGSFAVDVTVEKDTRTNSESDSKVEARIYLAIEVNIDLSDPVISTPVLTNVWPTNDLPEAPSPVHFHSEPVVIGPTFTLGIANIETRSKITELVVSSEERVLKNVISQDGIASERIEMSFGHEHTEILGDDHGELTILVEAVDEWGNKGEVSVNAYYYGNRPNIQLPDYEDDKLYPYTHSHTVHTDDDNDLVYYRTNPMQPWLGVEGEEIHVTSYEDYTLQVRAVNRAGGVSEQQEYVKIGKVPLL